MLRLVSSGCTTKSETRKEVLRKNEYSIENLENIEEWKPMV